MREFTSSHVDCQVNASRDGGGGCVYFKLIIHMQAYWNGLAIVFSFFWSDPSFWTGLSWPRPLRLLFSWPGAAAHTVYQAAKAMNPNSDHCFSSPSLLICIFSPANVLLQHLSVSQFHFSRFHNSLLHLGVVHCHVFKEKKPKSHCTIACHSICVQAG